MNWSVVRLCDVAAQPWRNGGGVTRELLAWPQAGAWTVRVSVAEIERDGPFSAFEGVQRSFAVLHGQGVRLDIEGEPHDVTPGSGPIAFDGSARVECALLDRPTQDLNLMVRGGVATMEQVAGRRQFAGQRALVAVYACEDAQLQTNAGELSIPAGALAWAGAPEAFDLTCARAYVMEVRA